MGAIRLNGLLFEPLTEKEFPLLYRWLNSPHVSAQWDGAKSMEEVKRKYSDKINSDWQSAYIVSKNNQSFGYIQSYRAAKAGSGWWPGELHSTVGIDQFIGEASFLSQGLGTIMVREFSDWLLSRGDIEKVITDPSPTNDRAIRCYENAGFKRVELVDTPEGKALLMEKKAG